MKKLVVLIAMIANGVMVSQQVHAQTVPGKLPINIAAAVDDSSKPMILYITGDGGWNKFSKNLAMSFAAKGYPVVALNAAKYFWQKKTPAQTATDITTLINFYKKTWNKNNVVLLGYSFGADVLPFIYNALKKNTAAHISNINLLSPSAQTDFEIHVAGLFGANSGGEKVTGAINKISNKMIHIMHGEDESDFPVKELTIKNFSVTKFPGGHHYDSNWEQVCQAILQRLPK